MSDVEPTIDPGAVAALVVATAPGAVSPTRDLLWRDVAGKPANAWALAALHQFDGLGYCSLVTTADRAPEAGRMMVREAPAQVTRVVSTADTSWRGAFADVEAIPADYTWILLLDAALPLVTHACLRAGLQAAAKTGVAIAAEPVKETLKRVRGQTVIQTPPRDTLRRLLTPVVLQRNALNRELAALNENAAASADLFALVQLSGAPLTVFDAGYPGLRATNADDLPIIETLLRQRQTEMEKA